MFFSEKEQLKQTKILNKIINTANNADNFSSLIEEIVKITIKLMNFDGGGIYLINEDTRTAELYYHIGLRKDFLKISNNIIIDDPRYSPVFISGKPIYAENLLKKNPNMAEASGFGSIMSIPLLSKEKIIGAMNIGSKDRYIISQFEREVLEYLSRDIGTVISKIQAEQRLKESEKKYKILTDNINDIIWTMDLNLKTTYVSPSTTLVLGFTPEEDMSMSLQEKFTPESLRIIGKIVRNNITPKTINDPNFNPSFTIELEQYKKDGSIIPTEVKVNPMRNENGIAFGLVGITRDISERKHSENELKEMLQKLEDSEKFLSNVFGSILDGISVLDTELNIIRVNPIMEEWYSYNLPIVGKKCYEVYHKLKEPCDLCPSQKTLKTGLPAYDTVSKKGSNDEIVGWLDLYSFPLTDQTTGKLNGVIEYVRDISEKREAEENLKESEKRYREAFNRAEFYKDLFTHDMNNILQSIQLTAEYFKLFKNVTNQIDKLDEIATTIKTQAKRGAKLISNIRKLSSLEDSEINLKPILISEHLNNSIKNINDDFQNLKIEIDVKERKDEITIIGDDLLVDIFDNILNNAVKFTYDEETILIEISIEKTIIESIPFVKLQFKDHGMGIKDERKDKIFQRSHVGEYDGQGMGMGLSLVRKIVERYGGFIKVEDRVKGEFQKGSNFIILFKEALR